MKAKRIAMMLSLVMMSIFTIQAKNTGPNPEPRRNKVIIIKKSDTIKIDKRNAQNKQVNEIVKMIITQDAVGTDTIIIDANSGIVRVNDTLFSNDSMEALQDELEKQIEEAMEKMEKSLEEAEKSLENAEKSLEDANKTLNQSQRVEKKIYKYPNIDIENSFDTRIPKVVRFSKIMLGAAKPYDNISANPTATPNQFEGALPELSWNSFHLGYSYTLAHSVLAKGKVKLFYGPNIHLSNYKFNNENITVKEDQARFTYVIDDQKNGKMSKLVTTYVGAQAGISMQQRTGYGVTRGMYLRLGADFGYRVFTYSREKTDSKRKIKQSDDFNFNDYTLAPWVEFGRNSWGVYVRYHVTPMFKEGQGIENNQVNFGVAFTI